MKNRLVCLLLSVFVLLAFMPAMPSADIAAAEAVSTFRFTPEAELPPRDYELRIFRGDLHAHTSDSDGRGTPRQAYTAARAAGLDFFSLADHEEMLTPAQWQAQMDLVNTYFNQPGEFIGFYGYELTYNVATGRYGHLGIMNYSRIIGRNTPEALVISRLYDILSDNYHPDNPNATPLIDASLYADTDFTNTVVGTFFHPGFSWGNFEEFAHWTPERSKAISLFEAHNYAGRQLHYKLALSKGWHVSPVFNSDTHQTNWGQHNGRAVVLATELTREALIEGMILNRTYATANDHTLDIFYTINGEWMGSRIKNPDVLEMRLDISTRNPRGISLIEVFTRDGIIVATEAFRGNGVYEWTFEPEFDYYYIRLTGNNTWAVTAPIWIKWCDTPGCTKEYCADNRISITDIQSVLLTAPAAAANHAVDVRFETTRYFKNLRVDFYRSPLVGFSMRNEHNTRAGTLLPFYTHTFEGTINPGTHTARGPTNYQNAARRITAVVRGETLDGRRYAATLNTMLAELYITEILPLTTTHEGVANAFQFIELYNNSNRSLELSHYLLRLWRDSGTSEANRNADTVRFTEGTLAPGMTAVLWFKGRNALTTEDFNAHFGTNLELGIDLFIMESKLILTAGGRSAQHAKVYELLWAPNRSGSYTGSEIIQRFQLNYGENIWRTVGNTHNNGEIMPDRAVTFSCLTRFTVTTPRLTADADPTPGSLSGSVVPRFEGPAHPRPAEPLSPVAPPAAITAPPSVRVPAGTPPPPIVDFTVSGERIDLLSYNLADRLTVSPGDFTQISASSSNSANNLPHRVRDRTDYSWFPSAGGYADSEHDHWIRFDFSAPVLVNQVKLSDRPNNNNTHAVRIEFSDGGTAISTTDLRVNPNGTTADTLIYNEIGFEARAVDWIKIYITAGTGPSAPGLCSVRIMGWLGFSGGAAGIESAGYWARESIESAIANGFVPAEIQSSYGRPITRLEFCRMAVMFVEFITEQSINETLAGIGAELEGSPFTDTDDPYILAAFALGITVGTAEGRFSPGDLITREQAATFLMRVMRVIGIEEISGAAPVYADAYLISDWAVSGTVFAYAANIMRGVGENRFDPQELFTREQSIVTFYKRAKHRDFLQDSSRIIIVSIVKPCHHPRISWDY